MSHKNAIVIISNVQHVSAAKGHHHVTIIKILINTVAI